MNDHFRDGQWQLVLMAKTEVRHSLWYHTISRPKSLKRPTNSRFNTNDRSIRFGSSICLSISAVASWPDGFEFLSSLPSQSSDFAVLNFHISSSSIVAEELECPTLSREGFLATYIVGNTQLEFSSDESLL